MALTYIRSLRSINIPKELIQMGSCRILLAVGSKGVQVSMLQRRQQSATKSRTLQLSEQILKYCRTRNTQWLWLLLDKRPALSELRRKDIESLPYENFKRFVKLDT